jgi:SAM-dependent methyltransferase
MNNLLKEAIKISGPLARGSNQLYSSYHLNGFEYTNAMRNTLIRFNQLNIPKSLEGLSVLDIGSNTGGMSFEFAKRGAKVVGIEKNIERVNFCNKISKLFKLNATFSNFDINDDLFNFTKDKFDIVCCLSIDAYVKNKIKLYKFLTKTTKKVCYLESNYPSSKSTNIEKEVADIKSYFKNKFPYVQFVGLSTKNGRRLFVLSNKYYEFPRTKCVRRGRHFHKRFTSYDEWKNVKIIYENIKDIPQVVPMQFEETTLSIITPMLPGTSYEKINKKLIPFYKKQIIDFIKELNKRGYAHRDFYIKNLIFCPNKLYVIDWEFVCENKVPLLECYELTGRNCELPGASKMIGAANIFYKDALWPSISEFFNISLKDFER